ncbi:hypothetical protein FIBSPDRAFT_948837 [Athelia psychrophila]|uniref:C2 domain-containing protein n=1 Tax=Athelia psychrophila TaxID=1759441 RepID=A0A166QJ97_9AGAM|nr:hypothetical protein FIBSPDRAFT_948837 [Fibularhizoctonia sp. CBS 109695]
MSPQSSPVSYTLQIISVNDLPPRPFKILGERRNVLVKATVEDRSVQTASRLCTSSPEWKETFQIEARETSSVLSLQLFDSAFRSTSLICASVVTISDLLQLCRRGKNAELILRDIKSRLKGRIRIHFSLSSNGSWIADEAQRWALVLSHQPNTAIEATGGYINDIDGLLAVSVPTVPPDAVSQSIVDVLDKLSHFMRIADEVAKVHPYAKLAWDVLSAAHKIIVAQVAIDQSVADLASTMQGTYSFVDALEAVPSKIPLLEDIIQRIFIQTVECAIFIREYSGHGFAGRLLRETMGASTPAKVAGMAQNLINLRGQFDTGVAVQIATISFRIQTDVTTLVKNQTLDLLGSSRVALSSRSRCLPGTRRNVIGEILEWALHPSKGDKSNVFFLHGVAGIGKSAVVATVATHLSEINRLGAFVGFDRAGPDESQPSTAVKTMARQMAARDKRLRASIIQVINDDDTNDPVLEAPLSSQFDRLIVNTLASIPGLAGEGPIVMVLDGLYECGQPGDWASILDLLVRRTESLPSNLRFIITSRTVNGVHKTFTSTALHPRINSRELRSSSHTNISAYFTFRMEQIRRKNEHLQKDWQGPTAIAALTARAFGFFPWAVSASNFVDMHNPQNRLQSLLLQPLRSISDLNTPLDEIYRAALNSAGNWTDDDFVKDFRAIIGAILGSPIAMSTTAIHCVLDRPISSPSVMTIIRGLGSVMSHEPVIQVLHPSFLDFLSSRERCGHDINWYFEVGPVRPGVSAGPATLWLQRMNASLKRNICDMTLSAHLTTEVLPKELAYACQSWVDHVCTNETFESGEMEKLMVVFFHARLLHWFEAMSLLKKSEEIAPMLQRVATWLEENTFEDQSLKDLVIEAIDFAGKFAAEIAEHPLYVYYTALPLLPPHSILYQLFHDSLVDPSVLHASFTWGMITSIAFSTDGLRLVTGNFQLTVWDTATGKDLLQIPVSSPHSAVFSYDGSRIACGAVNSTVYAWDSVSGAQVIGPLSHSKYGGIVNAVAWSTDGKRLLSGCGAGEVILWNAMVLTGNQPITKINHPGCSTQKPLRSVAFSSDGSQIASCSEQGDVYVWDSNTGGIVWSVPEPQGSDPWINVSFLSSDMGAFLVVKTKEGTQVHNASAGDLCPLPDSLAGAVGLTRGDFRVNFLMQSISKHNPTRRNRLGFPQWAAQGEYFAFAEENKREVKRGCTSIDDKKRYHVCYEMTATHRRPAYSASQARQPRAGLPHEPGCPPLPRQVPPLRWLPLLSPAPHEYTLNYPPAPGIVTMLQFQITSFAIFNNIVLFALYAVVLYILLRAMFKPFFSSQGHPRARLSRRPVARIGPNKVVFKDASSGKNAYSLHQFGKTAVYKAIQTIYAPHYASNHLAFFQPEIHGFTYGLVKTLDSETPLLSRLPQAKYSASESMPDREIVSAVMPQMMAGTDTATISLSYFL